MLGFVVVCGLSLVVVSGGYSLVAVSRLLTAVGSLVVKHGLLGVWASAVAVSGSRARAPWRSLVGFADPQHVGPS